MKNTNNILKNKVIGTITIYVALILLIYLFISLYFINHYFFNTVINGVDVSLKGYNDVNDIFNDYVKNYKLKLIERDGQIEEIINQDIGMDYNKTNNISKINKIQSSYKWIGSLFRKQDYYVENLFLYNKDDLEYKITTLKCLNKDMIEPKNVNFRYSNGSYRVVKEVYGNTIYANKLKEIIRINILQGKQIIDLDKSLCYENPEYTIDSPKTIETKNLLNKYVATKINYIFGDKNEIVDGNIIDGWLRIDNDLNVLINKKSVNEYVKALGEKYDTVGKIRRIKASTNEVVEVKGGFYGWKIDCIAETKELLKNIKSGEILQKEPIYSQKALFRGDDDIGDTYVEINITRQHLWFYKGGKLITQGEVVTGNPSTGNSTKVGVYMLNYKEKESTLNGPNYEAEVNYWMPFNGGIGIHDARWRYSFGGDIYKKNGSHGCVNAPLYLAKKIFENIEAGTPVICYEEEKED